MSGTNFTNLNDLIGRRVMIWCVNYVFSGTLVSVDDVAFVLSDPHVVYETGPLTAEEFKDAQPLPADTWFVLRSAVESLGIVRGG